MNQSISGSGHNTPQSNSRHPSRTSGAPQGNSNPSLSSKGTRALYLPKFLETIYSDTNNTQQQPPEYGQYLSMGLTLGGIGENANAERGSFLPTLSMGQLGAMGSRHTSRHPSRLSIDRSRSQTNLAPPALPGEQEEASRAVVTSTVAEVHPSVCVFVSLCTAPWALKARRNVLSESSPLPDPKTHIHTHAHAYNRH